MLTAAACSGEPPSEQTLVRSGRFGVFRDLVLVERPAALGGPFFMDRFETTRGDWSDYLDDTGAGQTRRWRDLWGGDEPGPRGRDQPMARISLEDARRFARWRFCRLPRLDEWVYAATDGGRYPYPWGIPERTTWANTVDLGLGRSTLVGTFESGRLGEGPYDLVGNVAEWTETPAPRWFESGQDVLGFRTAVQQLDHVAGLGGLGRARWPYPAWWIVAVRSREVPRLVVGWSFNERAAPPLRDADWVDLPGWQRLPGEWSDAIGVRLVADPLTMVRALADYSGPLTEQARRYLRRFLGDPAHRRVLGEAWRRRQPQPGDGPLADFLAAEIGL